MERAANAERAEQQYRQGVATKARVMRGRTMMTESQAQQAASEYDDMDRRERRGQ